MAVPNRNDAVLDCPLSRAMALNFGAFVPEKALRRLPNRTA
jgi:hypothetical protein